MRQLYNNWLVVNHDSAGDAYSLIKQCETEDRFGVNYQNAVAAYTAVPENVNTAQKLDDVEYKDSGVQQGWETWGSTNFLDAKDEANLELAG